MQCLCSAWFQDVWDAQMSADRWTWVSAGTCRSSHWHSINTCFLDALEKPDTILLQPGSPFAQDFFKDQESSSHSRSVAHQPLVTHLRRFLFHTFCIVWKQAPVLSVCSPADLLKQPLGPAVSTEPSMQYFYLHCCGWYHTVWTKRPLLQTHATPAWRETRMLSAAISHSI